MNNPVPTLKQLIVHDLQPAFVRVLLERIENIYPESHAATFNDPSLGEEQAIYVRGHYRRGLGETVLMTAAAEHGLKVKLVQPANGGCKHVYVVAGRFGLTMCHVEKPAGFPKFSEYREQSSKINEHISQIQLFPVASEPVDEEFYGVLVHAEKISDNGYRDKSAFGSLFLGFPNPEFDDWIDEPINLLDIRDIQQRLFQKQEDLRAAIQKTEPTWKGSNVANKKKEDK